MLVTRVVMLATSGSLLLSDVLGFARVDDGTDEDDGGSDGSGGDYYPTTDFTEGCSWLEDLSEEAAFERGVHAWGCSNDHGDGADECPIAVSSDYVQSYNPSCDDVCKSLGGKCHWVQSLYNDHCQDGGVNFGVCDGCGVAEFHNSFDCDYPLYQAYEDGELSHTAHARCVCAELDECDICTGSECGEEQALYETDRESYCSCIGDKCYDVCVSVHGQEDVDEYLDSGCIHDEDDGDEDEGEVTEPDGYPCDESNIIITVLQTGYVTQTQVYGDGSCFSNCPASASDLDCYGTTGGVADLFYGGSVCWESPSAAIVSISLRFLEPVLLTGLSLTYDAGADMKICNSLSGECWEKACYETNGEGPSMCVVDTYGDGQAFELTIDSHHGSWNWMSDFVLYCAQGDDYDSFGDK